MEKEYTKAQFQNITCFFALGYLMVFLSEVITAAKEDMLAGNSLTIDADILTGSRSLTMDAAAVAIAGFAHLLVKLILPWVAQKVPYTYRVILLTCLYSGGLVIIFAARSRITRLMGVAAFESGSATAEVTFLSLTAFYGDFAVNSFVAGGGVAFALGSIYYAGVTTWTCVSPRIAVALVAPSVFGLVIFYAIVDRSPLDQQSSPKTVYAGVRYSALHDQQEKRETHEFNKMQKFVVMWNIFLPMTYLFLQYFADHLSIQALVTPLAYPHKALYPIGHFTYYALAHNIGKFVGRVYLLLVSITCSSVTYHVRIKNTWILAAVGNALMFLSVFAAWFRFVEEVQVMVILCFVMGFIMESNYANSVVFVHEQTTAVSEREFALSIFTLGSSAGMYAGGLLALFLKPYLTQHCLFELELGKNCLPKSPHIFGWMTNVHC